MSNFLQRKVFPTHIGGNPVTYIKRIALEKEPGLVTVVYFHGDGPDLTLTFYLPLDMRHFSVDELYYQMGSFLPGAEEST